MTPETESEINLATQIALLPESDLEREVRTLYWEAAGIFTAFSAILAALMVFR